MRGEILGRDALPKLLPAWEDLCERCVDDNVYYSPRYALALLETVESDKDVRFAIVWDETRLVAMLPFTSLKFAIPLLRPARRAWQSQYTFSCMPLLDKLRKTEAAGILVDVLASISPGEWIIPTLNTKDEACQAIIASLQQRAAPWVFLDRFERATLEAGRTFDEHMKSHVSSKRRRDLARVRRRFEELGEVGHESHCFGEGLDRAVSAFLEIEASGWKGKRRTALACNEKSRKFATKVFTGRNADSICRADVLTLDGAPVAVSLSTLAGRTGFTVKGAYDEAYRRYRVGLLLEIEVIRSFLSENWAGRLDSATPGAHVIEQLWPGRVEVADLIFSLSPRYPDLRLSGLRRSEQIRRYVRTWMKRGVRLLRRYRERK